MKLTDFGIARPVDDPRLTTSGFLVGSPAFMAPERIAGKEAQAASDLWSLGVTLYFAVEGLVAFERGSTAATLHAIMNEVPYLTRTPGPLASAIMGMLISTPEARITADQAQGLLAMARAGTGVPTPPNGRRTAVHPGGGIPTLHGSSPNIARPKPKRKLGLIEGTCAEAPLEKARSYSTTKSCDEVHEIEVFETAEPFQDEVTEKPVAYPAEGELQAWAEARCALTFHSSRVDPDTRDQVSYRALVPSSQAWAAPQGDETSPARRTHCVAFKDGEGQLSGSVFLPDE